MDELIARGLLVIEGRLEPRPELFSQTIEGYVTSLHSRNGFSRDRMPAADAQAFDDAVREVVTPFARDGVLSVPVATRVVWGRVERPRG